MKQLEIGQEIETDIVAITDDCIFINLNEKSEGIVNKADFCDEQGVCSVDVGGKIKVFYLGEKNGEMRFTSRISGDSANQSMLENAWKNSIPVEGIVEKEIKGGYEIKIGGTRGFCPFSQMGEKAKEGSENLIGRTLCFKITEFKENGKNLLVSNRAIIQEQRKNQIEELKNKLKVGDEVTGKVISLQSYGAFVDIGGFQALLPVSEISRGRVDNIQEALQVGQTVTAQIIKADWEKERVSISVKNLLENPWQNCTKKYIPDSKHQGKIARVAEFGLFISLEPGIDGLLHISELKEEKSNTNLRVKYKVGQTMDVAINSIDTENKRISLRLATSTEQEETTKKYLGNQDDDGDTYNPFAALLKK